jgi:hypothetical protein
VPEKVSLCFLPFRVIARYIHFLVLLVSEVNCRCFPFCFSGLMCISIKLHVHSIVELFIFQEIKTDDFVKLNCNQMYDILDTVHYLELFSRVNEAIPIFYF